MIDTVATSERHYRVTRIAYLVLMDHVVEAWILAGELDGVLAYPALHDDVGGMPHGLRLAADLVRAGATKLFVIWNDVGEPPDLGPHITVVRAAPIGRASDTIIVARADRVFHRELPKVALAARGEHRHAIGKIANDEHDAVFTADRRTATQLIGEMRAPGGLTRALSRHRELVIVAPPPYEAFTTRISGPRSMADAVRLLSEVPA